jgi:hypothetical protein
MLTEHGDWMAPGNADEQKPAAEGTVEAWGRSPDKPGRRVVRDEERPARPLRHNVPPVLEVLGLAEVEHNARDNRMRAL